MLVLCPAMRVWYLNKKCIMITHLHRLLNSGTTHHLFCLEHKETETKWRRLRCVCVCVCGGVGGWVGGFESMTYTCTCTLYMYLDKFLISRYKYDIIIMYSIVICTVWIITVDKMMSY